MKCIGRIRQFNLRMLMLVSATALLFAFAIGLTESSATPTAPPLSEQELLRLGEKMYREGILPSGEPMQAIVKGDIPAPGTAFTCVSCHMRSGLGSVEGGVFTTPTNSKTLYQARDLPGAGNNRRNAGMTMTSKNAAAPAIQPPRARPAYTDETLADVLRGGKDPSGRILDMIMPRYNLSDSDMAIMVAYLKNLSNEYSPGVSKESINFATIVAEGVPPAQEAAMMAPLESFVKNANKQQKEFEMQRLKLREKYLEPTYRPVKLSRWLLKGSPDTWRRQLDDYYRQEPVFALLAGISPNAWQPVHDFCETNKIPCILPNTEFPVVAPSEHYTLYFSKGYVQEGEAAARYVLSHGKTLQGKKIVQIVANSPQGKNLADGFARTLADQGQTQLVTVQQQDSQPFTTEFVQRIVTTEKPDLLALWTGAETLPLLIAATDKQQPPAMLLVSSSALGKNVWTIPEQLRESTYITYPYRLPQDELRFARLLQATDKNEQLTDEIKIIKSRTYAALRVMTQALRDMKGNFYRDYLFDVISMRQDIEMPLYERLSFGPGQRYASKGCYIVQLAKGDKPELVKKSEWVIH